MATSRTLTPLAAARLLARVGERLQHMADRQARQEAKIARAKQRWDHAKAEKAKADARDEAVNERAARKLWDYFANQFAGEAKHLDLATGRLATVTRRQGATVKLASDEAIAMEILEKFPALYDELVTVVYKLDLRAIKANEDVVDGLTSIEVPGVTVFAIEPDNTEQSFRRPVVWFSSAES